MIKRITAFLLSVCLIIVAVPVYAGAATEQRVSVNAGSVMAGNSIYVTLNAENFESIAALDVSLHYDPSVFTVNHTYNGYMLNDSQVSVNTAQAGEVKLSAMSLNGITGYGELFAVVFDVKADCPPGSYPIDVAIGRVYNEQLENVSIESVDGSIIVEKWTENESFHLYVNKYTDWLVEGESLQYEVYNLSCFPFVSAEFVVEYDPEKFAFEEVILDPALTGEGALYSINSSTKGQVRIAYANDKPIDSYCLFNLKLTTIANEDSVTQVKTRATNVYRDDLSAYLPTEWNDWVTLVKRHAEDDLPDVYLKTDPMIVGKKGKSVFYLEKGAGVAAADFTLSYDPTLLRCVSVSKTKEAEDNGAMVIINDKFSNGTIRFSYIHMDANSNKDLPIVEILWEPVQTGNPHYLITPTAVGVVDADQHLVALEYVADSNCIFETKLVKPTCTQTGLRKDVCKCGKTEREEILPALGHDVQTIPGYAASCIETGMTNGGQCCVCNVVTKPQQIIPATGHKDKNNDSRCDACGVLICTTHKEKTIPSLGATCTEEGLSEGKHCAVCGEILLAQKIIPATGHTEVTDPAISATCNVSGKTEGIHCSACGEVLVAQQEIPALGHMFVDGYCTRCDLQDFVSTAPGDGMTVYRDRFYCMFYSPISWSEAKIACEEMGGHLATITTSQEYDAISSSYGYRGYWWIGARLNDDNQWRWVTGENWDYTHWDIGEPSGGGENCGLLVPNGWNDVVDDYNIQSGFICEWDNFADVPAEILNNYFNCGCTYGDTSVIAIIQEATCVTRGSVQYCCGYCGSVLRVDDLWGEHVWKDATCTEPMTCGICGATEGEAIGHSWMGANCTEPMICGICGATEGEAIGHSWTGANCTEPMTCGICGATEGEAIGHSWMGATCTEPMTCGICGATEGNEKGHVWQEARCMEPKMCIICWTTEGAPLGHDLTNCIITREAMCTVDGEMQKYCGRCPYYETEVIPAIGHDYTAVVTEATCTQQGYTTHSCSNCGDSYADSYVAALGHDYNSWWSWGNNDGHWHDCKNCLAHDDPVPHVPNPETNLKTCIDCGTLLLHTHNLTWIPAKEHTCTENGNIEYYTCTCGVWFADAEGTTEIVNKDSVFIVASGHNWKDATCTMAKTCETCGETIGNPLGHNWYVSPEMNTKTCIVCGVVEGVHITHTLSPWQVITEATCTETGLQKRSCTVCNDYIESETIPAKGHTEVIDKAVAATCTAAGKTEGKHCSVCNEVLVAQTVVDARGHVWKDATCEEPKICLACKITDGTALGHKYDQWDVITEPTCTQLGSEGSRCSICNSALAFRDIPAKGHTEVIDKAVAATCTAAGKTEGKHCTVCGAVTKAQQTVPDKGHTEVVDKAVAATCTASGKTEGKHCSVCNAVLVAQQTIPAKGHTEVVDKAVVATCTTTGKTEGKHCAVCNSVLVAQQTVPAKGHTEVMDKAVAATCTEAGKTVGKHCSVCNTVLVAQQTVPAIGHSWKDATCTAAKTCKTCGATSGKAKGHDWAAGNCTTPKTCKVCGAKDGGVVHTYDSQYDYKCNVCKATRTVDMTRPMVDMFRMYDPNSGEHFYTGSMEERENLVAVGWNYEGVGFTFPLTTGDPVHRLYDPVTGEHLYTMDVTEKNVLLAAGWNYEGIAFNSGFENEVPQYRLHNPNATRGAYHFTASLEERDMLISLGWEYQGIGWYSLGA